MNIELKSSKENKNFNTLLSVIFITTRLDNLHFVGGNESLDIGKNWNKKNFSSFFFF